MYLKTLTGLAVLLFVSCNQKPKTPITTQEITEEKTIPAEADGSMEDVAVSIDQAYTTGLEKAHKKTTFLEKKVVSFDIKLSFGGNEILNGKISMLTNTSKLRIDNKDGSSLIFDGKDLYASPKDANTKGARFGIFTWTYFFALPYKLNDPGVNVTVQKNKTLNDKEFYASKLTFDKNVGDAPDDWYILYNNTETGLLHAAAYIVTYGSKGDTAKAEEDPHAIVYDKYQEFEGIPIATEWKFYGWRTDKGLTDQLGAATLSNITLNTIATELFEKPKDGVIVE